MRPPRGAAPHPRPPPPPAVGQRGRLRGAGGALPQGLLRGAGRGAAGPAAGELGCRCGAGRGQQVWARERVQGAAGASRGSCGAGVPAGGGGGAGPFPPTVSLWRVNAQKQPEPPGGIRAGHGAVRGAGGSGGGSASPSGAAGASWAAVSREKLLLLLYLPTELPSPWRPGPAQLLGAARVTSRLVWQSGGCGTPGALGDARRAVSSRRASWGSLAGL